MKIYITGSVGSGKTTLARKLSREYGFALCELDSIVYEPDKLTPGDNRKRPEAQRDAIFAEFLANERWVCEDAGRPCFEEARRQADVILHLDPPRRVRIYRILSRWIKQNLRIEKCGYKPDIKMLKLMFKWTRDYDNGTGNLWEGLLPYKSKTVILSNKRDISAFIKERL